MFGSGGRGSYDGAVLVVIGRSYWSRAIPQWVVTLAP